MQRRTQAFLLIGFGLFVIVGVVLWLMWPGLMMKTPDPYNQPPGYREGIPSEPLPSAPAPSVSVPADPALLESRRLEDRLRRMAQDFASRAGSYSNADEFAALREAGLEATEGVRTFFSQERTRLTAAYPLRRGAWGQTARGLASKVVSQTPIRDQREVAVQVETQIITEAGDSSPKTSYRQAHITYQRSGDTWLVSRISWADESP